MRVLISGASIAGPVLAYWLNRYGFGVTVVERAPAPRKTGGHAVDLFRPAMQIVTKMGLLEAIRAKVTGTDVLVINREGAKPVSVDLREVYTAVSDNHVEIMRDDLSEIFYDATRRDVEYLFADSITSISDDGDVGFEHGARRRFDIVVGADGLHSNVRALTFGPESLFSTWIGAYLAVVLVPDYLGLDGVMETTGEVGRIVGVYSAAHMDDARAVFLFRTGEPLDCHHRDVPTQKLLLRRHFGDMGWEVPGCWPSWTTPRPSISTPSPSCGLTPGRAVASHWSGTRATAPARLSAAAPAWPLSVPTPWQESSPRTPPITLPHSPLTSAKLVTMCGEAANSRSRRRRRLCRPADSTCGCSCTPHGWSTCCRRQCRRSQSAQVRQE